MKKSRVHYKEKLYPITQARNIHPKRSFIKVVQYKKKIIILTLSLKLEQLIICTMLGTYKLNSRPSQRLNERSANWSLELIAMFCTNLSRNRDLIVA